MKVKIRSLYTKFLPLINQVSDLQKKGISGLTSKAGYAIAKNFNMAISLVQPFEKERQQLIEKYVQLNPNGQPITETNDNGVVDYIFLNDEAKSTFLKLIELSLDKEVEFNPFKFHNEELESCHNIPIDILSALEEFELITEVAIIGMKKIQ